jgi:hypothetical protein
MLMATAKSVPFDDDSMGVELRDGGALQAV